MGLLETISGGRPVVGEFDDGNRGFALSGIRGRKVWKLSGSAFYVPLAALCAWIFVYISGLYPYLGTAGDNNRSSFATSTSVGKYNFGLSTMLLFKGQTAFIEYKATGEDGKVSLDIGPSGSLGYSDSRIRVKGKQTGTLEVPIESTGLYDFEHEPSLGRGHGHTQYKVRWGARFSRRRPR